MSRIKAGIYGLCVADALGVPAETRTREDLKKNPITGMVGGGIHGQPAGYWSDDSSMTLCLAKSIGEVGYYHTHDIMARVLEDLSTVRYPTMNGAQCVLMEFSVYVEPERALSCTEYGLNWLYENVEKEYVEAVARRNAQDKLLGVSR